MPRWTRLIPLLAVGLVLGACGQNGGGNPLAPPQARHDGGLGMGGSRSGEGGGEEATSSSSTTSANGDGTLLPTAPEDSTSRSGGLGMGGS
jgi:hypothetical protein